MFRMILPDTLPDIVAAEEGATHDATAAQADAAAARTRADYGRVSRWGLGLLGTFGAAIGCGLLAYMVEVLTNGHDPLGDGLIAVLVLVIAAVPLVPSLWLLLALHHSGRRLARAAGSWAAQAFREAPGSSTTGGWLAARFLSSSSDLVLRLVGSALAGLGTVFAASAVYYAIAVAPSAAGVTAGLTLTILFASVCAGQFGGVQRIQSGALVRVPQAAPDARR
ncbi:hypothetical protein [Microbacterium flavum]|uniref:hypothetical protein n=1 Tax=Microbacterium flavum TaxID=415216 RepID=UPI0024AD9C3C|nr:hypothetical protein [Microbacterium flavum]